MSRPPARPAGAGRADAPPQWWAPAVLPDRWTSVAVGVMAALVLLHLLATFLRLYVADFPGRDTAHRIFSLNGETGLPAWFSTILLFSTALSLWLLARTSAETGRGRWVRHERALAGVFVILSIDEMTFLHEQTTELLKTALGLGGALSYAWVVLFVPLVVVVGLLYLGWLRSLPATAARLVVVSGLLYVGGAVGVELVGAGLAAAGQQASLTYALVVVIEELGEMLGVLLMLSVVTWLRLTRE